jgi:hypothetical protein
MTSNFSGPVRQPIFSYRHPTSLGLPIIIQLVMVVAFGGPALACIMFTLQDLPQNPWLVFLYMVACFPLVVLVILARLMSRYALAVYGNGDLEVTLPFSKVTVAAGKLDSIVPESRYVAATKSQMTWLRFVDHDGRVILSLSSSSFSNQVFDDFFAAARATNPTLRIGILK